MFKLQASGRSYGILSATLFTFSSRKSESARFSRPIHAHTQVVLQDGFIESFLYPTHTIDSTNIRPSWEPDKPRPLRDLRVLRDFLQVRTSLRPLEYDRARIARHTRGDQELVLWPTELHAADLVDARVDLLHESQLGLDRKDGDSVAAGVDVACVSVGDVDERLREVW